MFPFTDQGDSLPSVSPPGENGSTPSYLRYSVPSGRCAAAMFGLPVLASPVAVHGWILPGDNDSIVVIDINCDPGILRAGVGIESPGTPRRGCGSCRRGSSARRWIAG